MRRFPAILFSVLFCFLWTITAFADNVAAVPAPEDTTAEMQISEPEEQVPLIEDGTENTEASSEPDTVSSIPAEDSMQASGEINTDVYEPEKNLDDSYLTEPRSSKPGYGRLILVLSGTQDEITLTLKGQKTGKTFVLTFNNENSYQIVDYYPVDKYEITDKTCSEKFKHVKSLSDGNEEVTVIDVADGDFNSATLTVTEKNSLFIISFLYKEKMWLIMLAVLCCIYYYLRRNRALPSQEV